jgi:arylsulfatase A-like enzyme
MASRSQPNLLFVISDQHRGMDLGCAGNDDVHTPNVDRLAAEGCRFGNAYANYPLCSPSRATILTGQYATTHGVLHNDLQLPQDVPTIAKSLREQGYRTGYVGKWHLDGVPRGKFTPPGPRRQGFDDCWAVYNCSHDYKDAKYYSGDDPEPVDIDGYEPVAQTDLALEFVAADDDRPFCLFLSWGPPHDPYRMVPERYRERYDPDDLGVRENAAPLLPRGGHPAPTHMEAPPITEWAGDVYDTGEPYDYDSPREGYADYYAAITALDEQLGRLLDGLDRQGIADETAVVYTSDHGDMLWSQGRNQKGCPYEEAISIPFVVRWPGTVPEGTVADALFSTIDFAPTLLGLLDCTPPDEMEGTDISPLLCGESLDDPPSSVYLTNVSRGWRGVRTERFTYAAVLDGEYPHLTDGAWLLFDTERDPLQRTNRVYDPDYRDERDRLADLTAEWIEAIEGTAEIDSFERHLEAAGRVDDWNEKERTRKPGDPTLF